MTGTQIILISLIPLAALLTWMTYDLLRVRRKRRDWNRSTAEALAIVERDCGRWDCELCRRLFR